MTKLSYAAIVVMLSVSFPQVANTVQIAYWDHNGEDVNGNVELIIQAEYSMTLVIHDPNADDALVINRKTVELSTDWKTDLAAEIGNLPLDDQITVNNASRADLVDDIFVGVAPGTYKLWVRVNDAAGNWSAWTQSVDIITVDDIVPPTAPTGFGCKKSN